MYGVFFEEKYQRFERETPFDFSKRSSIGCGGLAETAFYPRTVAELVDLIKNLRQDGVPFYTLGNLTNVLPSDGAIQSVIVCTKKMRYEENGTLFFPSGISSTKLLWACQRLQKSGAEFLEGIPCTLGGALYMNAGVSGKYVAEILESVTVYREGEIIVLPVKDCDYTYKHSAFMDGKSVILGASLRLINSDEANIAAARKRYKGRRAHLPQGRSMGCVFKNPDGQIAGKLIDGAGLKGLRVGGATVSETHANFIVNDNRATANDVRTLIGIIKQAVFAQYKIRLEEEIRYIT
ncbi:MAG: UDP-N-acetylmuramate dehydrogenase [Clostridia bacterium]|nr:UDP-N-acetylmuramate dehydrogenase [Clostridia bacterium]